MLGNVQQQRAVSPSESDNDGNLCLINEDTALDNVLEGINPDDLTHGGSIQEEAIALVCNRTRTIQGTLLAS